MNIFKRVSFTVLLFPVVFLSTGLLLSVTGYSDYQNYKEADVVNAVVVYEIFSGKFEVDKQEASE